jgi:transcriptional regulator with XRE-family HTH domain
MLTGRVLQEARKAAGLTQAELARRIGTSQPEVARLESPRSNPRIATLNRAIAATGHRLESTLVPAGPQVDETLIVANLRLSPRDRLRLFEAAYRNLRQLAPTVRGERRGP